MCAFTPRCIVAAAAIVMVLVQHAMYVHSLLRPAGDFANMVWFAINGIEIVLLFAAVKMLHASHRAVALVIGVIAAVLTVGVVLEDFVVATTLGDNFWLPMSVALMLGLILSAMFLMRR